MPYESKAERERAQHRERWMTFADAIGHVRQSERCSLSNARQQLIEALADRQIRVAWADPESLRGIAAQRKASRKPSARDRKKLAAFRAKVAPQQEELRAQQWQDDGVEAITQFAWQKSIALGKELSLGLAAILFEIDHPPPPLLGSSFSPRIDRPCILGVPEFWRETRYSRGKIFDLTCDRWRVLLLDRAAVYHCWPPKRPDETFLIAVKERGHPGGRPSSKDEIHGALDALLSEGHRVETMDSARLVGLLAKRCGKTVRDPGWSPRTVQQHIRTWSSDRRD